MVFYIEYHVMCKQTQFYLSLGEGYSQSTTGFRFRTKHQTPGSHHGTEKYPGQQLAPITDLEQLAIWSGQQQQFLIQGCLIWCKELWEFLASQISETQIKITHVCAQVQSNA